MTTQGAFPLDVKKILPLLISRNRFYYCWQAPFLSTWNPEKVILLTSHWAFSHSFRKLHEYTWMITRTKHSHYPSYFNFWGNRNVVGRSWKFWKFPIHLIQKMGFHWEINEVEAEFLKLNNMNVQVLKRNWYPPSFLAFPSIKFPNRRSFAYAFYCFVLLCYNYMITLHDNDIVRGKGSVAHAVWQTCKVFESNTNAWFLGSSVGEVRHNYLLSFFALVIYRFL